MSMRPDDAKAQGRCEIVRRGFALALCMGQCRWCWGETPSRIGHSGGVTDGEDPGMVLDLECVIDDDAAGPIGW